MASYQIHIPEELEILEFDLKMMIATKLYEDGRVSTGQASTIVGISKRAFVELMGRYNASLFSSDLSDLEDDLANA